MATIWNVERIEWEDIPTLADLLGAAEKKTLLREIMAVNGEGEKRWKECEKQEARKRYKRIMELSQDAKACDSIIFPKHALKTGPYWKPDGYEVKPICLSRAEVLETAEGARGRDFQAWSMPTGHAAKRVLGYRVWLGGTWGQREVYRFLAERLSDILSSMDDEDAYEEFKASGAMLEQELYDALPFRCLREDVCYPEEVLNAKVYGLGPEEAGLEIPETPYEKERLTNNGRLNDMVNAVFLDELMDNIVELGKKLELGYEQRVPKDELELQA